MSKTLTAEEFEAENSIVDKIPVEYLNKWEFAEAYANYLHKAKVESIADEEIENKISEIARGVKFPLNSHRTTFRKLQRTFKDWYKQKLLE